MSIITILILKVKQIHRVHEYTTIEKILIFLKVLITYILNIYKLEAYIEK